LTQWSFSGNGKVLMACGGGKIHLWEPQSGTLSRSFSTGREPPYPVISFDGTVIATHSSDAGIRLWDATTAKERAVPYQPKLFGTTGRLLTFSPDGRFLVVSGGLQIETWEVATARRLKVSEEPDLNPRSNPSGCYASISPDGDIVATCVCGTLQLWEAQTGRRVGCGLNLGSGVVKADLAFSSDGQFLIGPGPGMRPVAKFLSSELADVHSHCIPFPRPPHPWMVGEGITSDVPLTRSIAQGNWPKWVNDQSYKGLLALSPDGKMVARRKTVAGNEWLVSLCKSITGEEVSRTPGTGYRSTASFSPDGRSIALLGNGYLKLHDAASGREIRSFEIALPTPHLMESGAHGPLAFSPNGKLLAATNVNFSIRLWEVATGKELPPLRGHHGRVLSLAFASDSQRLLSGSEDTTALIWDVASLMK
jgi:WD40 repeat protein